MLSNFYKLESRAEANEGAAAHTVVLHVAVAEASAPRVASSVLRRRPTPLGKSFVSIIA